MANNIPITLQWGSLAPGYAPANWQDLISQLEKITSGYVPGSYKPVTFGNSTPAAEDQDRPWIRTEADGSPDGRGPFVYFNGKWVNKHPEPAAPSYVRRIWVGSLTTLRSYDGGDGTTDAPTATTGAMWEEDTAFQDKIPIGVLAATGSVTTVLGTAGAKTDTITLTADNLPRHRHEVSVEDTGEPEASGDKDDSTSVGRFDASGADFRWQPGVDEDTVGYTRYYGKTAVTDITVDTVPPVIGVYVIKRTARIYYVAGV